MSWQDLTTLAVTQGHSQLLFPSSATLGARENDWSLTESSGLQASTFTVATGLKTTVKSQVKLLLIVRKWNKLPEMKI